MGNVLVSDFMNFHGLGDFFGFTFWLYIVCFTMIAIILILSLLGIMSPLLHGLQERKRGAFWADKQE